MFRRTPDKSQSLSTNLLQAPSPTWDLKPCLLIDRQPRSSHRRKLRRKLKRMDSGCVAGRQKAFTCARAQRPLPWTTKDRSKNLAVCCCYLGAVLQRAFASATSCDAHHEASLQELAAVRFQESAAWAFLHLQSVSTEAAVTPASPLPERSCSPLLERLPSHHWPCVGLRRCLCFSIVGLNRRPWV